MLSINVIHFGILSVFEIGVLSFVSVFCLSQCSVCLSVLPWGDTQVVFTFTKSATPHQMCANCNQGLGVPINQIPRHKNMMVLQERGEGLGREC